MIQTRSNRYNWEVTVHLVDGDVVTPREIGRTVAREFTTVSREYAQDGARCAETFVFGTS